LRYLNAWLTMPFMFRPMLTAAALAAFLAVAPGAKATAPSHPFQTSGWLRTSSEGVSLDEAIRRVREMYGDVTILKAETRGSGDRRVHRIKILTASGRVKTVSVDAQSGAIR
jgi:uncharacterized membrane protein YkoI